MRSKELHRSRSQPRVGGDTVEGRDPGLEQFDAAQRSVLAALARAVAAGDLDLEGLKSAEFSTPDLKKRLLAIKGIGDYAAANLLMILGRYDHIPIDSWALKVVSYEWPMDRPAERQAVENAFARWGAWKGLAFWFWDWSYYHQ